MSFPRSPRPGLARGDDHGGVGGGNNDDDDDDDDRDGGRSFRWLDASNGNEERKERARTCIPTSTLRIPRFPAASSSEHARTHNVTRSSTTTMYDIRATTDQSRGKAKIRREIYLFSLSLSLSIRISSLPPSIGAIPLHIFSLSLACVLCISSPSKSILSVRPFPLPPSDGFCSPLLVLPLARFLPPPRLVFMSDPLRLRLRPSKEECSPLLLLTLVAAHASWRNEANRFSLCEKVGRFGICGRFGHRGKGGRGGQIMTRCVINNPPSIQSTHYNRRNEEAPTPFQGRKGEAK